MDKRPHAPDCFCYKCEAEQFSAARAAKDEADERLARTACSALFGVEIWNPLEHGIHGVPLMVPAHEYNRVASNLADALSLAVQYVPLEGCDADRIRRLERAATILPNVKHIDRHE